MGSHMKTQAQQTKAGRRNYGQNYQRGRGAEGRAAAILRRDGWSVNISPGSRGPAGLIARKGTRVRRIQVKAIGSRDIRTVEAARRRVKGKPFNVSRGREVWLYSAGTWYRFTT